MTARPVIVAAGMLLLSVAAAACTADRPALRVETTLGATNSVSIGAGGEGIIVEFTRVENDSRCPAGVQCVRAGEAFVTIATVVDGGARQESVVEMAPGGQETVRAGRFRVTLLELRPDPPPAGGVPQDEYELRIRVEESGSGD